jgi:hypothetical protein
MGFPLDGIRTIVQSAAATVASLAGQAVSMLSLTLTQVSGQNALNMTTGSRLKLGSGSTDYLTSDGGTFVIAAGGFQAGSFATIGLATNQNINFGANSILNISNGVGVYGGAGHLALSAVAPTISSGFGTSPSIASSNGALVFTVNVGGGGVASSGVIAMPAATNGWIAMCTNTTTPASGNLTRMSANATNSITITNYTNAGVATAWAASDVIGIVAVGF